MLIVKSYCKEIRDDEVIIYTKICNHQAFKEKIKMFPFTCLIILNAIKF
jgi:hypothetical protein